MNLRLSFLCCFWNSDTYPATRDKMQLNPCLWIVSAFDSKIRQNWRFFVFTTAAIRTLSTTTDLFSFALPSPLCPENSGITGKPRSLSDRKEKKRRLEYSHHPAVSLQSPPLSQHQHKCIKQSGQWDINEYKWILVFAPLIVTACKTSLDLIHQLLLSCLQSLLFLVYRNKCISLFFLMAKFSESLMGVISMREYLSGAGITAYVLVAFLIHCKSLLWYNFWGLVLLQAHWRFQSSLLKV